MNSSICRARQRPKRFWANVKPIELAARDWLAASDWVPIPADKDGGYVLVKMDVLKEVQSELLAGPWYSQYGTGCDVQTWKALVPQYRRLAKEVAELDDRVSVGLLCSSLSAGPSRLPSRLIHTCKTHKEPGEVSFRAVHSSTGHSFLGLMSWVSLVLKDALAKYAHLVSSSADFLKRIKEVHVSEPDIMMHMDLKDFFMTGSSQFLTHHSSLILPISIRPIYRRVVKFLLDYQFITSWFFPGEWWRVVQGSGMGLRCSSYVSDAAFLHCNELCGLGLITARAQQRFGIISYTRYRDNMLFILRQDFSVIRSLKLNVENNMLPYIGTTEEVSHIGVTFLDLNIVKDDCWRHSGCLSYSPYMKPTSFIQALSITSAHKPSTHEAWMRAYVLRLRRHSSSLTWFRTMKWQFLFRLRRAGIDQSLTDEVDRSTRFSVPSGVPVNLRNPVIESKGDMWIVLPFHPVWADSVNRSLHRLALLPGITEVLHQIDPHCDAFRVAWCLSMPSLGSIVRKF